MNIKRLNRGIALGCVLVVGTVCYVVYDQKQFSKNHDIIKSTVEQYLEETASAQIIKDQQLSLDAYKKVLDKYWTNTDGFGRDMDVIDKRQLTSGWDTLIKDIEPTGFFEKYEIKIGDISIKKYGSSGAMATVDYNIYTEFFGMPLFYSPYGVTITDNWNYDQKTGEIITDPKIKYSSNGVSDECEFYLQNIDKSWKIVGMNGYIDNSNCKIINDESDDKSDSDTDSRAAEDSTVDSDKKAGDQNG